MPARCGRQSAALSFAFAGEILIESVLSFVGLGLPPGLPNWGNMLSDAQAGILAGTWWVALYPGLMILLVTLAVNLLGDGLQTRGITPPRPRG